MGLKRNKEADIMSEQKLVASCSETRYEIRHADLPLSCPTSTMAAWDAHPRVYLEIEKSGEASCPYCGAVYILVDS